MPTAGEQFEPVAERSSAPGPGVEQGDGASASHLNNVRETGAPGKGGAFQWVRIPPGEMLEPDATGATVEVTKRLKPLVTNASRNTVTWRVYRP